jgi:hypothetical protein
MSCDCPLGISIFAGRDYTAKFTLTTSNPFPSTPYDLTGARAWLTVKEETDSDADTVILKRNYLAGGDNTEINIIDPSNGILEVYFIPDDTKTLQDGGYWFDLVIENADGKTIQAVAPSRFNIKYTVTKL